MTNIWHQSFPERERKYQLKYNVQLAESLLDQLLLDIRTSRLDRNYMRAVSNARDAVIQAYEDNNYDQ